MWFGSITKTDVISGLYHCATTGISVRWRHLSGKPVVAWPNIGCFAHATWTQITKAPSILRGCSWYCAPPPLRKVGCKKLIGKLQRGKCVLLYVRCLEDRDWIRNPFYFPHTRYLGKTGTNGRKKSSAECLEIEKSVKSLKQSLTQVEEKQISAEPVVIPG